MSSLLPTVPLPVWSLCLAQGHNTVPHVGIEPMLSRSVLNALPLCHCAPCMLFKKKSHIVLFEVDIMRTQF